MEIKPLFTATATATGGRNGQTRAEDGSVSVNLSVPKAMGVRENPAPRRLNISLLRATRRASGARSITSERKGKRMRRMPR